MPDTFGGLSHPALAEVFRAVERATFRLPLVCPPEHRRRGGRGRGTESNNDAVRRHSTESTGTCSTGHSHSSADTDGQTKQGLLQSSFSNLACSAGGCLKQPQRRGGVEERNGESGTPEPTSPPEEEEEEDSRHEDFSGSTGEGLEGVDVDLLRRRVEPIRRALEGVDTAGLLGLAKLREGSGARVSDGVSVRPIHGSIRPPRRYDGDTCVRYLHITELDGSYSMGVFVFPPGATIPLHDHPGMCVLSRVLYGRLTARSFDVVRRGKDDDEEEDDEDSEEEEGNGSGGDAAASYKRKSSFAWVAETLAASRAAASPAPSSSGADTGAGDSSGGGSAPHRPKIVNRTGSWLSSLLFPYRRESSSSLAASYNRQESSSSLPPASDRKPRAEPSSSAAAAAPTTTKPRRRRKPKVKGTLRAYRNPPRRVAAPRVQILFPSEGNAHEFTAGPEGAAVLDVLLPPYDFEHQRDCTFYRVEDREEETEEEEVDDDEEEIYVDAEEEEQEMAEANGDDKGVREEGGGGIVDEGRGGGGGGGEGWGRKRGKPPCWLIPIPQPKDFHCISGTYGDFGRGAEG